MASQPAYKGCVYQIGEEFLKEWGIDVEAYTGNAINAPGVTFDYRYNTK